ncbi:unnamed protein product [Owenia fusiformis]|uniref:Alpha/beta hydrolase fold-3 domain-containing protein n=1 Tax=Owenia fusiformis TaxID=6347 RepID=A0A8S4NF04_OWEFU|nr:unnamed protein product [Owenia fusiformis]
MFTSEISRIPLVKKISVTDGRFQAGELHQETITFTGHYCLGSWLQVGDLGQLGNMLGIASEINMTRILITHFAVAIDTGRYKDYQFMDITDTKFGDIPVRIYRPPKLPSNGPAMMFFHGGGFAFMNLDTHDIFPRTISKRLNMLVVSVDYRRTPEHPSPAGFHDCLNATIHLMRHAEELDIDSRRIAVAGDSAGGNLATTVAIALRDMADPTLPDLKIQVMIYPTVQVANIMTPSCQENFNDPMLTTIAGAIFALYRCDPKKVKYAPLFINNNHTTPALKKKLSKYMPYEALPYKVKPGFVQPDDTLGDHEISRILESCIMDHLLSPLFIEDLSRLPISYMMTVEYDVLRDEGYCTHSFYGDEFVPANYITRNDQVRSKYSFYADEFAPANYITLNDPIRILEFRNSQRGVHKMGDSKQGSMIKKPLFLLAIIVLILGFKWANDVTLQEGVGERWKLHLLAASINVVKDLATLGNMLGIASEINMTRTLITHFAVAIDTGRYKDYQFMNITDTKFGDIPVRIYRPPKLPSNGPAMMFFHGGGFAFMNPDTHDIFPRTISKRLNMLVVSVDYRRTPEHPSPAGFHDCLNSTIHLMRHAEELDIDSRRIAVAGDSAGGNLATTVAIALRDMADPTLPDLKIQVMIYPTMQEADKMTPSCQQNFYDPMHTTIAGALFALYRCDVEKVKYAPLFINNNHTTPALKKTLSKYMPYEALPYKVKPGYVQPDDTLGDHEISRVLESCIMDPLLSPLFIEDLSRLPISYMMTVEYDVLRDEGHWYAMRLKEAGNKVTHTHIHDGFHSITTLFEGIFTFDSGIRAVNDLTSFLKQNL